MKDEKYHFRRAGNQRGCDWCASRSIPSDCCQHWLAAVAQALLNLALGGCTLSDSEALPAKMICRHVEHRIIGSAYGGATVGRGGRRPGNKPDCQ